MGTRETGKQTDRQTGEKELHTSDFFEYFPTANGTMWASTVVAVKLPSRAPAGRFGRAAMLSYSEVIIHLYPSR